MSLDSSYPSTTTGLGRHTDLALATLVVSVIVMMALPLPPWTLDILVAANLSIGVTLLLIALFVRSPLAFSTFPSVLLITTLFRISLNVATTRQILLHAHAGDIINVFGRMVVGGSLVVGLVIFLIITVVQFIVVAKGAERVAEVGARFTLDALPGKQMSIDADMRAGTITQTEALAKRRELVLESQFYGAMDGGMKFVKGDAIASIVIVAVNLLGGITIGVLSMGMGVAEAVQRYSVLSIGDGLVAQIPALFVSIAAGITITRTAPDNSANLGDQIGRQLGAQPRALLLAAGVMVLFALVPGFPKLTFLVLSMAIAILSVTLTRRQREQRATRIELEVPAAAREGETAPVLLQQGYLQDMSSERPPSSFRLDLSEALIKDVGIAAFNSALARERAKLRDIYGIPFPGLVLRTATDIPERAFSILVQELAELTEVIPPSALLVPSAMDASRRRQFEEKYQVLQNSVPEWLMPARWVSAVHRDALLAQSFEVLDGADVVAQLVTRAIQRNPAAALGVQEVRQLIREIEWRFGDLAREAQAILPLGRLADLMAALARERVPLADFPGLLQAVVTYGPGAPDTHTLYEAMRLALARGIVARLLPTPAEGAVTQTLNVVTIDTAFETHLRSALMVRPDGPSLAMAPAAFESALGALIKAFEAAPFTHVLVTPADLRRSVSRLFRAALPRVAFLSHEELATAAVRASSVAQAQWVTPTA